jgi:tRNA(Ile)-lysidine synthase
MDDVYTSVVRFCRDEGLIERGDRILLSLSAGKDSMALFDIMLRMRREFSLELAVFHLNHLLRGAESDGDERFLADFMAEKGVPCYSERADVAAERPGGTSLEEYAREKRYRLLEDLRLRLGFPRIATAHSRDDSVETVIMRIFSGTGIHGLTGILPKRGVVIRPLLACSSDMIYAYLRERGICWREDSTNRDTAYLRNFVRSIVIPEAEKRFPRLKESVERLSVRARETNRLLDRLLEERNGPLREWLPDGRLRVNVERYAHDREALFHVLSGAMREFGLFASVRVLEEISRKIGAARTGTVLYERDGVRIAMEDSCGARVLLSKAAERPERPCGEWEYALSRSDWEQGAALSIPEIGKRLSIGLADRDSFRRKYRDADCIFVDIGEDIDYIYIRNRRDGDRIRLEAGEKKVKKLFIDEKLDLKTKEKVPHLVVGSRIAAVMIGFAGGRSNRVAGDFLVKDTAKKILAIHSEDE